MKAKLTKLNNTHTQKLKSGEICKIFRISTTKRFKNGAVVKIYYGDSLVDWRFVDELVDEFYSFAGHSEEITENIVFSVDPKYLDDTDEIEIVLKIK